MNMNAMKPHDWVPFWRPVFSNDEMARVDTDLPDGFREKLTTLQDRYLHLVRERVIQGNISEIGPDTPLFRTMSCKNFHRMVHSGKMHLTNPLVWATMGDTWEISIIEGGVYLLPKNANDSPINVTKEIKESLKKWYGQSWSLTNECDAIWTRYAQNGGRAVCISTTARKLLLALFRNEQFYRTTFLEKVHYLSDPEILREKTNLKAPFELENSVRRLLMLKRKSFEYENEVRLLYWDKEGTNTQYAGEYLEYPLDGTIPLSDYVDEVILDPNCPEECAESERAFLHEHGLHISVTISSLRKPPEIAFIVYVDNRC